ncbi:hypothetical protein GOBAR_AA03460 [Gossypium barbadense]|uniref:Uncharacterized protein n=1 Tax=Gossypium barbadense TaxID=3634 RepID=A0A2P5YNL0_GOSBA|nr:hypothetical protein GOBAR_AA03460 [Gossypium barbadense]
MYAHMVEALLVPTVAESDLCDMSGGRSMNGSHGHGFYSRTLCQICGRYDHLAQRCFYRFNRDYKGPNAPTMAQFSSAHDGQGLHSGDFSGRSAAFGGSGLYADTISAYFLVGHGVGLASGPHMPYGPYDKPHIGRDMRRALGRDLGRDLGQHCVGPSVMLSYVQSITEPNSTTVFPPAVPLPSSPSCNLIHFVSVGSLAMCSPRQPVSVSSSAKVRTDH